MPSTLAAWRDRVAETERGRLALWLPVFMGAGVALYFSLTWEPPIWLGAVLILPAGAGAWLARRHGPLRALALLLAALGLGFSSIQFATWRAPPVEPLPTRAVVVSGVVTRVELLPEGAERVTLTQPRLHPDTPPLARDLRIRLRADDPLRPRAGDRIEVRALLRAPQPPLFPGARDMQRDAFFHGLAGGGMALSPARRLEAANVASGVAHAIQRLRGAIAERFAVGLPGAAGAIGSALFTGQTAAIPRDDVAAFRNSGLAHLLAVSGLHVGIVIGLVFSLVRLLLALSEHAALRWPCKQIAALAGLAAAVFYTPLAGAQVPLLRSVAMASLIVLGIVVGRRALTLRGLALAATAVLLLAPQELPGPSLQMSFAAVLALIAGHEALRPLALSWRAEGGWWRRRLLGVGALVATSLLAGSATAVFGLYHFGRVQLYFVLANLVAVPLTGLWVMPWGLVALALMPLGWEFLALAPMGWGLGLILWVAHVVAGLPGAVFDLPVMPLWGLLASTGGLLWLGLWRGWWRLLGAVPLLLGLASPVLHRPADGLVSADARAILLRAGESVYLRQEGSVSRFVLEGLAGYWAAGEPRRLPVDERGLVTCTDGACRVRPRAGAPGALVLMKGESLPLETCGAAIVLAAVPLEHPCPGTPVIDRFTVWRDGAHAVWLEAAGPRIVSDRMVRGDRPWVAIPPRRRPELPPAKTE